MANEQEEKVEGTPTSVPEAPKTPSLEEISAKVQKFETDNQALREQLNDAQRKITEISTEKATLEQRVSEIKPMRSETPVEETPEVPYYEQELAEATEMAVNDPVAAIRKMGNVVKRVATISSQRASQQANNVADIKIRRALYVNDLYKNNPDLKEFDNELGVLTQIEMSKGKPFEDAANNAVTQFRNKLKSFNKVPPVQEKKEQATTAPEGARGESGTNPPPTPKPAAETVETRSDYVANRQKRFMKQTSPGK